MQCLICHTSIDYRWKDAHFPAPANCVTISNPTLLSRSGTGLSRGI